MNAMTSPRSEQKVSSPIESQTHSQPQLSLSESFQSTVKMVESSPEKCVDILEKLQEEVAMVALFSRNEGMEDISTKAIPLLSLEHYLAVSFMGLPATPTKMLERKMHVSKAMDLWVSFFQRLEDLEILSAEEQKTYHRLLREQEQEQEQAQHQRERRVLPPMPQRDEKIARFRAKQQIQQELQRLQALKERRGRLGVNAEEIVDVFDEESLERSIALKSLEICKVEAFDSWDHAKRELPMIDMMVNAEKERQNMQRHAVGPQGNEEDSRLRRLGNGASGPGGLQVTHITSNAVTGQIEFRREEIRSQVFRPGWNQPTMTLEELGNIERAQAIEREERQKQAEAEQKLRPQRYEQLVRDGLEDNSSFVDASAALDRAWDDWKDENPRGSGNKRGDQGDRNF